MKLQNWAPVIIGLFLLAAPALSLAEAPAVGANQTPAVSTNETPAVSGNSITTLQNPLNVGSFCLLLKSIFNDILIVGIPVATLFIVYAGFKLVAARGNATELATAKRNLWYIVVGIAIFLGAWTLSQIIANTLAIFTGGGGLC